MYDWILIKISHGTFIDISTINLCLISFLKLETMMKCICNMLWCRKEYSWSVLSRVILVLLMDRHPTDLIIFEVIFLLYLSRLKFEMFQLQRLVLNKISIEIQFKNDIKYKPLPRAIWSSKTGLWHLYNFLYCHRSLHHFEGLVFNRINL